MPIFFHNEKEHVFLLQKQWSFWPQEQHDFYDHKSSEWRTMSSKWFRETRRTNNLLKTPSDLMKHEQKGPHATRVKLKSDLVKQEQQVTYILEHEEQEARETLRSSYLIKHEEQYE